MTELDIYIDGASKGNPGHSGIGVVICQGGNTVKNISRYIGQATNNIAEYTALIFALQEALIMRADIVKINTDSQLLYRQINRTYKVRHPNITGLFAQALRLMSGFTKVSISHIPREKNRAADKLATQAVNKEVKKTKQTSVLL